MIPKQTKDVDGRSQHVLNTNTILETPSIAKTTFQSPLDSFMLLRTCQVKSGNVRKREFIPPGKHLYCNFKRCIVAFVYNKIE